MKFVDMKLDPAEAKEEVACPSPTEGPAYPWGLCVYLDEVSLAKLNMDATDFPVGSEVAIMGMAKVTGISMRQREGGEEYSSVDLQLTELGIGNADELEEEKTEDAPSAPRSVGSRLYGGK